MFQLITEENYDATSSEHKGACIYFATDEQLLCNNIPKGIQTNLLNYIKEHAGLFDNGVCYYILDMDSMHSVVFTIDPTPFMMFMATLSPDPQN